MNGTSDTSKKVMDRIMSENKWAVPEHNQESKISNKLKMTSLFLSILFLVGISVSFIYITPSANPEEARVASYQSENVVTTLNPTDFARTFTNLSFDSIKEGAITSIGEPKLYEPSNNNQMILTFAILGISIITLFLSWLSRENESNRT